MTPGKAIERLREIGAYCEREDVDDIENVVLGAIFCMLSMRTTDEAWEDIKQRLFYKRT